MNAKFKVYAHYNDMINDDLCYEFIVSADHIPEVLQLCEKYEQCAVIVVDYSKKEISYDKKID